MDRLSNRCVRLGMGSALVLLLLVGPACGGGGGPTGPGPPPFGVVGASLTWLAIQGYDTIGGTRGWPYEELRPYGGVGLSTWAAEIEQPGSFAWGIFRGLLESQPPSEVWWQILVEAHVGPPTSLTPEERLQVTQVGREIRRLVGPGVPIYASPFPDYAPSAGCNEILEPAIQATKLMVDFAVAEGLAERGPIMRPITGQNNGGPGDPCHQGPEGRRQHGQDLRDFFGG